MRCAVALAVVVAALPVVAGDLEFVGCLPGSLDDVCRDGDFVYGATPGGLVVLDVSDPAQPVQAAFLPLRNAVGVAVDAGYAYVACPSALLWSEGDLHVVDIHDPHAPRLVATSEVPQYAVAVVVAEDIAYVADSWHGVLILDVSDPTAPCLLSSVGSSGPAQGLALAGTVLYLADQYEGLRIIDVSVPAQPVPLATWDPGTYVYDVGVVGDLAVVGASAGIRVLDVSDPAAPHEIGALASQAAVGSVTIDGLRALLTHWDSVSVVDLADPTAPTLIGATEIFGRPSNIALGSGVVLVGAGFGGLRVLDLVDPTAPVELGAYPMVGGVGSVEIHDQRLYVAGGCYDSGEKAAERPWIYAGLFVVDLAGEGTPPLLRGYLGFGNAEDTAVVGDLAHVTDYMGRLSIINVSDPTALVEVGAANLPYRTGRLAVAGGRAFALTLEHGMRILDVHDPEAPVELGTIAAGSLGVAVRGSLAYVTDDYDGLQIFDVSDPAAPVALGSFDPPNWANDLDVVGSMVYLANGISGLRQIDVGNPLAPVDAGVIDTPGFAAAVVVQEGSAYVADTDGGVRVIDISDRDHLVETGYYLTGSKATTIDVDGETVVVGTESGGVFVLRITDPTGAGDPPPVAPPALRAHPNPFNPRTTISYVLATAGQVTLTIHDARGRRVAGLLDGPCGAGTHAVDWTGVDDNGRSLPSGTYFCRMETTVGVETRKVAVVR